MAPLSNSNHAERGLETGNVRSINSFASGIYVHHTSYIRFLGGTEAAPQEHFDSTAEEPEEAKSDAGSIGYFGG